MVEQIDDVSGEIGHLYARLPPEIGRNAAPAIRKGPKRRLPHRGLQWEGVKEDDRAAGALANRWRGIVRNQIADRLVSDSRRFTPHQRILLRPAFGPLSPSIAIEAFRAAPSNLARAETRASGDARESERYLPVRFPVYIAPA